METDGENMTVTSRGSLLVDPEMKIPPEVSKVHGITDEDVMNAPTFRRVATTLSRKWKNAIVMGYNVSFDVKVLQAEFERVSVLDPWAGAEPTVIDVMKIWQKLEPPDAG